MRLTFTDEQGQQKALDVTPEEFKAMLLAARGAGQQSSSQQQPQQAEVVDGPPVCINAPSTEDIMSQYYGARGSTGFPRMEQSMFGPVRAGVPAELVHALQLGCMPAQTKIGQFFQDPTVKMVGAGLAGLLIGGLAVGFLMSLKKDN